MTTMAKSPKRPKPEGVPSLYLRLDPQTFEALMNYINAQETPPEKNTVGLVALRQFLARHGHYPPPRD